MEEFKTSTFDERDRNEEMQWSRILSSSDPVCGMVLLFTRNLCTAFHEYDPALRMGALQEKGLDLFKRRLLARLEKVLTVLGDHGLCDFPGAEALEDISFKLQQAARLNALADLTAAVDDAGHLICDALEKKCGGAARESEVGLWNTGKAFRRPSETG